jgi:RNA polymerase sigma-70 factor (ECF subfamily)
MHEPEPGLVGAARAGDIRAFEDLVRLHQGDVWRFCLQLLRDESLADDMTQDVFLRAHRFLPGFHGDSKFSTWLFQIARNCVTDELRRRHRRARAAEKVRADPPPPPSDVATGMEVREALASLPLEVREPIVLIDMFGLRYAEVARIMDVPLGTVKSRVHVGRMKLVEILTREEGGAAGGR